MNISSFNSDGGIKLSAQCCKNQKSMGMFCQEKPLLKNLDKVSVNKIIYKKIALMQAQMRNLKEQTRGKLKAK